ncbi:hypothetical protein EIP86_009212 [Pleurotus ostreatoroseus]|nr:hypothetical protein EIP86_009212 [Pleurotus ostreatoroseus]
MSSPEAAFNGQDNPLAKPPAPEVKKRKRGATRLSCAECRRLKLRCDRAIPCGSCVKRGCAAICPDGTSHPALSACHSSTTLRQDHSPPARATGQSSARSFLSPRLTSHSATRFVLASTQDLHEKILELSNRVRELEDGLRTSHAQNTNAPHPLLADDLLRIKAPIQRDGLSLNGQDEQGGDVVDSFGSLSISDTGRTNFFGQATSSFNEGQQEQERDDRLAALNKLLPPEVLTLAGFFPIAPNISPTTEVEAGRVDRLRSLFWYLPPADEAADLRQIYFQHAGAPVSSLFSASA